MVSARISGPGGSARQPIKKKSREKICLTLHTKVSAAEMVLIEDLAGRAETADLFH